MFSARSSTSSHNVKPLSLNCFPELAFHLVFRFVLPFSVITSGLPPNRSWISAPACSVVARKPCFLRLKKSFFAQTKKIFTAHVDYNGTVERCQIKACRGAINILADQLYFTGTSFPNLEDESLNIDLLNIRSSFPSSWMRSFYPSFLPPEKLGNK